MRKLKDLNGEELREYLKDARTERRRARKKGDSKRERKAERRIAGLRGYKGQDWLIP